jgi:hypothetical protein
MLAGVAGKLKRRCEWEEGQLPILAMASSNKQALVALLHSPQTHSGVPKLIKIPPTNRRYQIWTIQCADLRKQYPGLYFVKYFSIRLAIPELKMPPLQQGGLVKVC